VAQEVLRNSVQRRMYSYKNKLQRALTGPAVTGQQAGNPPPHDRSATPGPYQAIPCTISTTKMLLTPHMAACSLYLSLAAIFSAKNAWPCEVVSGPHNVYTWNMDV
jgi:hypothetical protein